MTVDDQRILAGNSFQDRSELRRRKFLLVCETVAYSARGVHHLLPGFPVMVEMKPRWSSGPQQGVRTEVSTGFRNPCLTPWA
jgi:hypothetical protein